MMLLLSLQPSSASALYACADMSNRDYDDAYYNANELSENGNNVNMMPKMPEEDCRQPIKTAHSQGLPLRCLCAASALSLRCPYACPALPRRCICAASALPLRQGGKYQIPKAGCHVIGRRATRPTSDLIVMIYCSKV